MSFLTPLAFAGAALAVPIILLYMLRLRRREVIISSTFLWQQILRDSEANTPWQRLRRNLLLLLQLLILSFIVFALARPFIVVPTVSTGQIELLLDASASMNARDMNGQTRFEAAKEEALGIIETLGQNDTMTVIRVADIAEVIAPSTNDHNMLRSAIINAEPSQAEADWVAALTLASADAINTNNFNMVIISDGGLGDASGLPGVPGTIQYIPVGESAENLAISALATRALPGQTPELFAQVTNYGGQDADVIFDIRVDGELFSAERYTIPAGSNFPIVTTTLPDTFKTIQAGLTTPTDSTVTDFLRIDNSAWEINSGNNTRRALLLTQGNLFLEQVLRSLPEIEAFKGEIGRPLPTDVFDLYILDGWLPEGEELPAGDLLIIDPPQSTSLFTITGESEETQNPEINRNDPRMTFVNFANVNISRFKTISGIGWADELIWTDGGPLLVVGEQGGRQIAILTFDIHDSDLPLQITWPILMSNLLEWFKPREFISAPNGLQVGQSLLMRPAFEATRLQVTLPDNQVRELTIDQQTSVFADTRQPGVYRVDIYNGNEMIQTASFAVNLFSATESRIAPQESINISGNIITPTTREAVGQQEFWPWAVLLALFVLLIEWVVYQRRIQVRTVLRPAIKQRTTGVAR